MVPAAAEGVQATTVVGGWQRGRRLVVLLVLLTAVGSCASSPSGGGDDAAAVLALETRLAEPRDSFRFAYRARGTGVLDCVLPNRQLDGTVFPDDTVLLTTETPGGRGTAIVEADAVYLSSELFSVEPDTWDWLRIDRQDVERVRPQLTRILGADLTSYVAASGPPPDGNATVAAMLEGDDAQPVDPIRTPNSTLADGFRFVVEGDAAVPVVDGWIDPDGEVARVQVRDSVAGAPGTPAPDTGWVLDYLPLPSDATAPEAPTDAVAATDDALTELAPPMQDGCELEIGREPADPSL
ncbi:MAG: hypothetical protein ACLGIZ_15030 [Acidimicrobiia bacterium]